MAKTLLVLENDITLKKGRNDYVLDFISKWDGDVIELTGLTARSVDVIQQSIEKCDTIAVETCFVDNSMNQFFEIYHLLKNIKTPKNIYIYLMAEDLEEFILANLNDKNLYDIRQHKIWKMSNMIYDDEHICLNFDTQILRYEKELEEKEAKRKFEQGYAESANQRPTGRKVKILACNAMGAQFISLPIGDIVDELDMSETDPNTNRGVWVWGKSEAIKLINDCGLLEYEIVSNLTVDDLIVEISKQTDVDLEIINAKKYVEIKKLIEKQEDTSHNIAQYICDSLNIERRYNRAIIRNIIDKYNSQVLNS